jgi:NADPH:quinone reductase-like Zn-dependent oxidoreductase
VSNAQHRLAAFCRYIYQGKYHKSFSNQKSKTDIYSLSFHITKSFLFQMSPLQLPSNSNLPKCVYQTLQAIYELDSDKLLDCFPSEGVLIDEGKHYDNPFTIREWFDKGLKARSATIKVLDSGSSGATHWVRIRMDGDYAEFGITEPFELYFHFSIQDDSALQLLRINQIAPDEPTMRAVWAASGNPDDPLSALRTDLWKVPEPPVGWVRVKLAAVGLNYHDIFTLRGLGMFGLKYPLILGNEGAGTLDDGTEVIIFPVMGNEQFKGDITLDPDRHVLGELTQGSLAEYVIVPRRNIIPKPKGVSFESASVLGIAWLTAYRMLFTRSGLKKGQTMLVQGSTGGVATALIQLGRAAGMAVWSTGRTEAKRALALKLGAHRAFSPGEVLPEKVAAVFDLSGQQTFKHSMESLGTGGTLVCCGLHSGGLQVELDIMKLFTQGINVHGTYAGNREEFESLVRFIDEEGIVPYVGAVVPLEKAEQGLRMIMGGRVEGKVVVRM